MHFSDNCIISKILMVDINYRYTQFSDLVSSSLFIPTNCNSGIFSSIWKLELLRSALMLELWTLVLAMERLAPITIGSYNFSSPKLMIASTSKLILVTSTSKYWKRYLSYSLWWWKESWKRDLSLGLINFYLKIKIWLDI